MRVSYSKLSSYLDCPRKWKLMQDEEYVEDNSPALVHGRRAHKFIEDFLVGKVSVHELNFLHQDIEKILNDIRSNFLLFIEHTVIGIIETVEFKMIIDCMFRHSDDGVTILDWKTGKFNKSKAENYTKQLEFYSLLLMMLDKKINNVRAQLVFVDEGIKYPSDKYIEFARSDLKKLWPLWFENAMKMINDTTFKPRPKYSCEYCKFNDTCDDY